MSQEEGRCGKKCEVLDRKVKTDEETERRVVERKKR